MPQSLRSMIIFLALSPWSNEVSDMMNRLKSEKRLEQFPLFKQLLTNFTTPEIFAWPLNKDLADVIRSHPIVAPDAERSTGAVHTSAKAERVVGDMLDVGVSCGNWWDDLKKRVIQHVSGSAVACVECLSACESSLRTSWCWANTTLAFASPGFVLCCLSPRRSVHLLVPLL